MQKDNFLKKGSGSIKKSKGMTATFWTQSKKGQKMLKRAKSAKYLKIWAKMCKFENILKKGR